MLYKKKYDYLIVGAGLSGAMISYFLSTKYQKKCIVIDARSYIGGNCHTTDISGITVHEFGPHIFRTDSKRIWDLVNSIVPFHNFINSPIANYHNYLYNLPFNMNTFHKMWGVRTPDEAKAIIAKQISEANITNPEENLESKAISLVGTDIYRILIREYTEKQWGMDCSKLPADIIKRLPVRFTFDNNYFTQEYQGIPDSYTEFITNVINSTNTPVELNTPYNRDDKYLNSLADKVIYTGRIDSYYNYELGVLPYRGVRFETEVLQTDNFQGVAVMNFTSHDKPYTRITEHKHFVRNAPDIGHTVISKEYPMSPEEVNEDKLLYSSYPINTKENMELYNKYASISNETAVFAGRLGKYKYYDMDNIIKDAEDLADKLVCS